MKRKIGLKLVAFVLFGLCLLSVQKAEAALQQALDSNTKASTAIDSVNTINKKAIDSVDTWLTAACFTTAMNRNRDYKGWAGYMMLMYGCRAKYIGNIMKRAEADNSEILSKAEYWREMADNVKDKALRAVTTELTQAIEEADINWATLLTMPAELI